MWTAKEMTAMRDALAGTAKWERGLIYARLAKSFKRKISTIQNRAYKYGFVPESMRPAKAKWRAACAMASERSGVPVEQIMSRSRMHRIVRARWIAFTLLREQKYSLPAIAAVTGYDHTTCMHGLARHREIEARRLRKIEEGAR